VTFVVYSFWAEYYGGLENNGHWLHSGW
jgi:hypothetical protein